MKSFYAEVYKIAVQIPRGKVVSYGQIAQAVGSPRSARIVGYAMRNCPDEIPWHRVVKTDGTIASGVILDLCRELLEDEGIVFLSDGRIDMESCRWDMTDIKERT